MSIRSPATRRERARAGARQDILLAAAEVFARRGYAAATLAELASAAGFAAPSLYRYFASKEEIFREIVDLLRREMGATFETPVDRSLPLAARLEVLLAGQYRLAESRRAVFEVLRNPGPGVPADVRHLGSPHAGLAFYEERLAAWLRRNASPSELRHGPELTARAFAAILFSFHPRTDGEPCDEGSHRLVVSLALEGLAAPAGRRRGASTWTAAPAPAPSPSRSPRPSPPRAGGTPRRQPSRRPPPAGAPSA
ncbi:MAG TPA: helix-turn-helix domain-containing protein [Anaeromyxobacter sp.]